MPQCVSARGRGHRSRNPQRFAAESNGPSIGCTTNASVAGALRVSVENSQGNAITLAPKSATVMIGNGVFVKEQVVDAGDQRVAGAKASWRSSNTAVAIATPLPDSGLVGDHGRAAVRTIAAGTAMLPLLPGETVQRDFVLEKR